LSSPSARGNNDSGRSDNPCFSGLTDIEWHAFDYCLKEGVKLCKRKPLSWDEANTLAMLPDTEKSLFPEIIHTVVKKYYYIIGFDLAEDFALLGCVIYLRATNMPALMKVGLSFFGFSG
jgi:hypothetical protein